MWITLPTIQIPQPKRKETKRKIDPLYKNIYLSFSRSFETAEIDLLIPRAAELEGEDLAVSAIKSLLSRLSDKCPHVLIDCRSSAIIGSPAPSYKLAKKSGLSSILPFSIGGQEGAEAAQGLLFLKNMEEGKKKGAILSILQCMVTPDTRLKDDGFPLGDAAAASFVSDYPIKSYKSFNILNVAVGQKTEDWDEIINYLVKKLITSSDIDKRKIRWSIPHNYSDLFRSSVQKILPNCKLLIRDLYSEVDFGCADSLISLNRIFNGTSKPDGIGIIWFVGRFGSIGALLIEP